MDQIVIILLSDGFSPNDLSKFLARLTIANNNNSGNGDDDLLHLAIVSLMASPYVLRGFLARSAKTTTLALCKGLCKRFSKQ